MKKSNTKKEPKERKKKVWTPHRYLVAAIRKTWRWSPSRRIVLKASQVQPKYWKCAQCAKVFTVQEYTTTKGRKRKRMAGAVDHIKPIGAQPKTFDDYPEYLKRTFCSEDNLQVLCTECHAPKSKAEREKK